MKRFRLLGPLSYKLNPLYRLVVRAQDGGAVLQSNTTIVEIAVTDVNVPQSRSSPFELA